MNNPKLALKEGSQYLYYKCCCKDSDNEEMICRLIKIKEPSPGQYMYYVQFMECNGRVDDWYP